jgi:uncharacterized protein
MPAAASVLAADRLPFEQAENRIKDDDGHLHIASSPISKAMVCPYYGHEIPNAARLGLQPGRMYRLLRDPSELAKAAPTFNGKPLLIVHKPTTADDHDRSITVGAVRDPSWDGPYLRAALDVWDGEGIDGIETNALRQLSASYRYDPDMTPGVYQGEPYDGVMRNIRANHVALVEEGRAGPDVMVSDSRPRSGKFADPACKFVNAPAFGEHPRAQRKFVP